VGVADEADRLVEGVELLARRAKAVQARPGGGPVGAGMDEAQAARFQRER